MQKPVRTRVSALTRLDQHHATRTPIQRLERYRAKAVHRATQADMRPERPVRHRNSTLPTDRFQRVCQFTKPGRRIRRPDPGDPGSLEIPQSIQPQRNRRSIHDADRSDQGGNPFRCDRTGKRQCKMQMVRRHQASVGRNRSGQPGKPCPQGIIWPESKKDALQIPMIVHFDDFRLPIMSTQSAVKSCGRPGANRIHAR